MLSLLSLLPPSCMIVPIRELANTLHSFTLKPQNNQLNLSKCYLMDIEIDFPRGHSASPSLNSFRGTSASSAASSIDYADHIQVQADNMTWTEQVENGEVQSSSLFYAPLKNVMLDTVYMEPVVELIYVLYTTEINNATTFQGLEPTAFQGLEPLVILYQAN